MSKKKITNRLEKLFEQIKEAEAYIPAKRSTDETHPSVEQIKDVNVGSPAAVSTDKAGVSQSSRTMPAIDSRIKIKPGESETPSALSSAFRIDEQKWATLKIIDETAPRAWDSEEQMLVKQVADQLSLALDNARLFQETQKRAEELTVLNEMGRELSSLLDIHQIAEALYKYANRLMDTTNFFVALYDEQKEEISFPLVINDNTHVESPTRSLGQGLTDYVIRSKRTLFIPEDVAGQMKALGIKFISIGNSTPSQCWLGVPLLIGTRIIGVISVQSVGEPNLYSERHRDLLTAISSQAAITIQNARLFDQIRASEARFRDVAFVSADYLWECDTEWHYTYVSDRVIDVLGYKPEELLKKTDVKFTSAEETKRVIQYLEEEIARNGRVVDYENRARDKDGNEVVVLTSAVPILDESGKLIGYRGVDKNITEQKRSEEALARSEAELRALFSSMNDVVLVVDKETRYLRIAPTNPSRLYRPAEELLGQKMTDVLPPETHELFRESVRKALETGEIVSIDYPLDISGNVYWFNANLSKLTEDQVFWVARDITDRRKAEDVLRRQNEYLAVAAEIGRLVTSTLDLNVIFTRGVNLIRDGFGYYHAAIFTTEESGFNAILREASGEAGEEMKRQHHVLAVGSKSIVGTVTSNGQVYIANNTAIDPIHNFNPLLPETHAEAAIPLRVGTRIIGAIDIQATDVDAFIEADISVLQILADQIAVAIDNARSYDLAQQAVKEMREVDQLKSQFLANMSHELRTPLNSIIGFSRVILKGIDGPVSELQQQDLTAIYNSGQHLLGLINDILDVSKIEAGKMELALEEVNLGEMINSVMSTATGLVKDKPIKIKCQVPDDLPTVHADAIRIRQILINLLSNAAKFTEEGLIRVEASVKSGPAGHSEMMVSVSDTGPGISIKDQEKLFQPFSQVDASPTRKTGGTGLGLSISHHLVQLHGGRIGVHSTVGKGSTFYFTLPLYRGKAASKDLKSSKIILSIDDKPQVISLYERYLQPQGYQVVALADPSRARERAHQLKPYAITLDIMMPGYDGWQVITDLKSDPETRDIPVIICSIVEDEEKGYSLGATDYLVKPILEDDLLDALNRLNSDGSIKEILIIDDTTDDLRLISKMLSENKQYKPILAEGGKRGWEAITTRVPHAIILDLFMPDMDGFAILEKMRQSPQLRDIPVIVVSGVDLTPEQQQQLGDFGQRLLSKGSLSETELLTTLDRALKRINPR
jgi:PAS domain S-box-containing protein